MVDIRNENSLSKVTNGNLVNNEHTNTLVVGTYLFNGLLLEHSVWDKMLCHNALTL